MSRIVAEWQYPDVAKSSDSPVVTQVTEDTVPTPAVYPRYFCIDRLVDRQGLTGTGLVADGLERTEGGVVYLTFRSANPTTTITTMANVTKYQCDKGESRVVWCDPSEKISISWDLNGTIDSIKGPCLFTRPQPVQEKVKEKDEELVMVEGEF